MTTHRPLTESDFKQPGRGPVARFRRWFSYLPGPAKVALVCSALGFVLSLYFKESVTVNGVTTCTSIDFAKIGFGLAALFGGIGSALQGLRFPQRYSRLTAMIIGAVTMPIGVFHLLVGLGLIFVSC